MEAKNKLRYSDMPIKEIVGRLNFADQPTFHKFFKYHTGITPMQYRRGDPESSSVLRKPVKRDIAQAVTG